MRINKIEAMKKVKSYLDTWRIDYTPIQEMQKLELIEDIDCIVIPQSSSYVIGKDIEIQLRFRQEHVYLMAYYAQIFATKENYSDMTRLLNHINGKLSYNSILDHSMVLDEDTGDIYNGVLIRYELLQDRLHDVMRFILEFQKQLLSEICYPLVKLETKEWTLDEAKAHIDKLR